MLNAEKVKRIAELREYKTRIIPEGWKICRKCGKLKKVEDFYKNKATVDGLTSYCKECSKAKALESQHGTAKSYEELIQELKHAKDEIRRLNNKLNRIV